MWSNLIVLHSESRARDEEHFDGLFHWKTCMRTVYVGDSRIFDLSEFHAKETVYQKFEGFEAYKLLLKIISGLKSRLLGETEVMGQFREVFKNEALPVSPLGDYLQKLRDRLIEDSKKLRTNYLRNLGDQSYGGLAYRYLKGRKKVTLVGTGQLAEKLLPWILKEKRETVRITGRNLERLTELAQKFNLVPVALDEFHPDGDAIVVAAPVSLLPWQDDILAGSMVVDFREDPFTDSFAHGVRFVPFEEMLQSLKENERKNEILRAKLDKVVDKLVNDREQENLHNNIFGWEDIPCLAY